MLDLTNLGCKPVASQPPPGIVEPQTVGPLCLDLLGLVAARDFVSLAFAPGGARAFDQSLSRVRACPFSLPCSFFRSSAISRKALSPRS